MGSVFEAVLAEQPGLPGAIAAVLFVAAAYFLITLDRARANSPSKDDTQVGIKLVLFGIVIAGVLLASTGVTMFLAYILSGAKGGSAPVRAAIPAILVGLATVAFIYKMLLPRTNAATQRQPERFALGLLGLWFGVSALIGVSGFLSGLFLEVAWARNSGNLASTVVSGAIGFLALTRLGAASGWTMPPPPPAAPPMQYPPQGGPPPGYGQPPGGGYGPPSGGMPPQGGGYGPPSGGMPPQGGGGYGPPGGGGGYGPPSGGMPPQGGGYPPR